MFDRSGVLVECRVRTADHQTQLQCAKARLGVLGQVVFVKSRFIKCGQVRLSESHVSPDAETIAVVPLQSAVLDSATEYYAFTQHQWSGADRLDGYRVLRLVDATAHTLSASPPVPPMEIAMEVEHRAAHPGHALIQILQAAPVSDEAMLFQCGMLADFIVMRRVFPTHHALRDKWRRFMQRAGESRTAASASLMAQYVRAKGVCIDDVTRQWMAMECALFKEQTLDTDLLHSDVLCHIASLPLADAAEWQHGQWHQFRLTETGAFWRRDPAGHYTVSAMWLLEDELAACCTRERLAWHGHAVLSAAEFDTLFVPCLYRHMLLDALHCWLGMPPTVATTGLSDTLRTLATLRCADAEEVFEFNAACLQWHTSPVMKRAYRYFGAQTQRPVRTVKKLTLAPHVDMEDLFAAPAQYLPPCLAQLITGEWYKHEDRKALVGCLVDSGYTNANRAVDLMCRGPTGASPHNRGLIRRLFQDLARKKTAELDGKRVSRCCDTLINAVFQDGNRLRCPFEAAANGPNRRRDHSKEECEQFKEACAASLDVKGQWPLRVYSPLDYVSHKLAARRHSIGSAQ